MDQPTFTTLSNVRHYLCALLACIPFCCLLVVANHAVAETKFFQCKDKWGQPVFSEKPCGADATTGSIAGPPESGSVAPDDFTNVTYSNKQLNAERQIEYLEDRIKRYEKERDTKLDELHQRTELAYNNLAGAHYRDSLASEMRAVTSQYKQKIDADNKKIELLRESVKHIRE